MEAAACRLLAGGVEAATTAAAAGSSLLEESPFACLPSAGNTTGQALAGAGTGGVQPLAGGGAGRAALLAQVSQRSGEAGREEWVDLELKVVADVGIIGIPNGGEKAPPLKGK